MSGTSSARPARLQRFGKTTGAMDEALRTRIGHLEDALRVYRQTCEMRFRFVPTVEAPEALRAWSRGTADLGAWTTSVGDAFEEAGHGGEEAESVGTSELADIVGDDAFRGVPEGGWQLDADRSIHIENPDAFGELLGDASDSVTVIGSLLVGSEHYLKNLPRSTTITVRVTANRVLLVSDGTVVTSMSRVEANLRLRLPGRVPASLQTASKWVGRTGGALGLASAAYDQWQADAGLDTSERVLRSATRGLAVGGLGFFGAMAGGGGAGLMSGTVCAPGAPACSGVLGFGGALIGGLGFAFLGDKIADILPWMDPPEPKPGEYDLDGLADEIAQEDAARSEELGDARVDVYALARDLVRAETADQPDLHAEVIDITTPPAPGEFFEFDFSGTGPDLITVVPEPIPMGPYLPGQVPENYP